MTLSFKLFIQLFIWIEFPLHGDFSQGSGPGSQLFILDFVRMMLLEVKEPLLPLLMLTLLSLVIVKLLCLSTFVDCYGLPAVF